MYGSVFTPDFLQNVTRDRNLQPLQNCLLSTGSVVYRTPWKNVINPLLVTSTEDALMQARNSGVVGLRGQISPCSTHGSTGTLSSRDSLGGESTVSEPALSRSLTDMGIGSLHREDSDSQKSPDSSSIRGHKLLSFSTDLSNPNMRKRHPRDSAAFESRRLFRKSYMEALQNPMNLGSSSESILEEPSFASVPKESMAPVRKICARGWLGGDESRNGSLAGNPSKNAELSPNERRSKSLERTNNKTLQVKGHRARSSSGGSNSGFPKKLINGYGFRFGKLELEAAFPGLERRSSKENSGLCCNVERGGRAVVQVCCSKQVWSSDCTDQIISVLLCYYCSSLRKEKRELGLTVLVDARRQQTVPSTLISALSQFQTSVPNALYSVLFLVEKEAAVKVERDVTFPYEVLTSLKALQKHIDSTQLTTDLDGTFPYDHSHYINFRQKIEPFASSCSAAISFLQSSIETLNNISNLETAQEVSEVIGQQKSLMKNILDDTELNRLRLEGGTFLARLRKEEMCENHNYSQIKRWFYVESERHLAPLDSFSLSLSSIQDMSKSLELFMQEAREQQNKASVLLRESDSSSSLLELNQQIISVLQRCETRRSQLHVLHNLYEFYQSANEWMLQCQEYLCRLRVDGDAAALQMLQDFHSEAQQFSPQNFSSFQQTLQQLESPGEEQRWRNIWRSCKHTQQQLEELMESSTPQHTTQVFSSPPESLNGGVSPDLPPLSSCVEYDDAPQFPRSLSTAEDTDSDCTVDSSPSEPHRLRKQPLKKIMKTLSYEPSAHHGYTGVYIRGLEVSNNVSAEKKLQRPDVKSPVLTRSRSLSTPCRADHCHSVSSKVQHIMDEMISTEREYVRSLIYVVQQYFPEMERLDLPQDLRGKRSIIFGNLEKLSDFHSLYFLKELERCSHSPLTVSRCFLMHEEQFGMYALYSKNKPRSDALLTSHGNAFFRNKQVELGDKMDLASYLLKPIQRMSKYALLLKDLIKECSESQEQELADLRTAEEMVKFQLRHGNDLLAMDAIRGCDVNLKEQGQLRCQDEFIVWCGRKKYLRHVFLFEDLILFSKTKKIEGGYDIYIYKQSFKTAEIGMTESVGDSGLRFEIWFRRRKTQDTFILQAASAEVKSVWTGVIGKILWRQALRNRELRMQEMVSMGIGNKPFMDIKPSDSAISDRAVDYTMKSSDSRTRTSIAVSSVDHSTPFKRPHSTISNSSSSSSSSQSSSSLLNLHPSHTHPAQIHPSHIHPSHIHPSHWPYDCIEEDELEHESSIQNSMIGESVESSSSQCTSSDSISNLSIITVQHHPALLMEKDSSDGGSCVCTPSPSPSPPTASSSVLYHTEQELQTPSTNYITAL
uniref:uncharacterized protein LOC100009641 n=1 Tax=Danio rerio TaxID=7955 RepID=UPI003D9CAEFF